MLFIARANARRQKESIGQRENVSVHFRHPLGQTRGLGKPLEWGGRRECAATKESEMPLCSLPSSPPTKVYLSTSSVPLKWPPPRRCRFLVAFLRHFSSFSSSSSATHGPHPAIKRTRAEPRMDPAHGIKARTWRRSGGGEGRHILRELCESL